MSKNNVDYCPEGFVYCGVFLKPVAKNLNSDYYIRQPAYDEWGNELDSDHFAVYKQVKKDFSSEFADFMQKIAENTDF